MYLAAAASMPWYGHAACYGTTMGGERSQGLGVRRRAPGVQESGGLGRRRQCLARRRRPYPYPSPKTSSPTAPAFIDAAREMGMPILDDVNGPMVPGAGYINMNIAA